ncbi:hypothetical protein ASF32_23915 [Methylobacterium sp. Leaf91]|nr:hypothetical protein ASF32_23915 [Methylobacterium sp. Leaf91]
MPKVRVGDGLIVISLAAKGVKRQLRLLRQPLKMSWRSEEDIEGASAHFDGKAYERQDVPMATYRNENDLH